MRKAFKATWSFILLRFAAVLLLSLVYIFVAAQIQYWFVLVLGESTFNYIISGLLSLFVGIALCAFAGKYIMLLINGWHIAALPYANKVLDGEVSALSVGFYAFKAHFTSFGIITALGLAIGEIGKRLSKEMTGALKQYPAGEFLLKISTFPLFENTINDMISSAYDCTVFYLVKYTKPGMKDDAQGIVDALKAYAFCLPKIIAASIVVFVATNVLPKFIALAVIVSLIVNEGIVGAIFLSVLIYPLWFLLNTVIFRPIYVMTVLGVYSDKCVSIKRDPEYNDQKMQAVMQVIGNALNMFGIENSFGVEQESKGSEEVDGTDEEDAPEVSEVQSAPVMQSTPEVQNVSAPKAEEKPIEPVINSAVSSAIESAINKAKLAQNGEGQQTSVAYGRLAALRRNASAGAASEQSPSSAATNKVSGTNKSGNGKYSMESLITGLGSNQHHRPSIFSNTNSDEITEETKRALESINSSLNNDNDFEDYGEGDDW